MADESRRWDRWPQGDQGHDRDRRGAVDSGLPVQPPHAQGGGGDTGIRADAGNAGACPPVRDDGVPGARGRGRPRKAPGDGGGLRAGDVSDRGDGEGGAKECLSPLELHPRPQLPDVESGYRGPVEEGTALVAEVRPGAGDVVSVDTSKFDRITDKALDVLEETLNEHRLDADHLRLVQIKLAAAQTIISNR